LGQIQKGEFRSEKNPNIPCTGQDGPVKPGHDEKKAAGWVILSDD
jgi:hypothetical protein